MIRVTDQSDESARVEVCVTVHQRRVFAIYREEFARGAGKSWQKGAVYVAPDSRFWLGVVGMRPMRVLVAALLACGALTAPTLADDVKSALKDFGLIGTWSPDCSKELSQSRVSRIAFAAPDEGKATATAEDNNGEALVTTVYEIVEAAIVDSDKIGVGLHPVTITRSNGAAASQHDYDNVHLVFQKVGERIEVIRVQFEGLPEIERAIFFEGCLN